MIYTFETTGVQNTMMTGMWLAQSLKGGEVLLLEGDLGAGKTVFAKGLALGLGVQTTVTSPTFVLCNSYEGNALKLHHFDFYRLNSEDEAEELGLEELFGASNAVCAVEWASKIPSYLPESYATVTIEKLGENRRKITIRTPFEVKL